MTGAYVTWTHALRSHSTRDVSERALQKVGRTIRLLREAGGHSQESFAQYAGIERSRYGKIERGKLNISLAVLFQLAYYLQTHPSDLLADINAKDCIPDSTED